MTTLRSRSATYCAPEIRFGFGSDGATVEHGYVRLTSIADDAMSRPLDHRARGLTVIVVRAAAERSQVHAHAAACTSR
jgi:hypothetical protein